MPRSGEVYNNQSSAESVQGPAPRQPQAPLRGAQSLGLANLKGAPPQRDDCWDPTSGGEANRQALTKTTWPGIAMAVSLTPQVLSIPPATSQVPFTAFLLLIGSLEEDLGWTPEPSCKSLLLKTSARSSQHWQ